MCVNCVSPEGHNCVEYAKHVLHQKEQQDRLDAMRQHGLAAVNEVVAMKQSMAQAEIERQQMM
eukprot:9073299-Prorocentrum_lima.AAC.1